MKTFSISIVSVFLLCSVAQATDRSVVIIHRQGEQDCHTFRIPAIARTNSGTLLAVYDMRYNSRRDLQGHMDIGLSRSTDHNALPEPVCMASLIAHPLPDGRRVLFFSNPNSTTRREQMTLRMSLDDGTTWPAEKQILLDEKGGAYSSLVMVDDRTLGILYESSRADLVF